MMCLARQHWGALPLSRIKQQRKEPPLHLPPFGIVPVLAIGLTVSACKRETSFPASGAVDMTAHFEQMANLPFAENRPIPPGIRKPIFEAPKSDLLPYDFWTAEMPTSPARPNPVHENATDFRYPASSIPATLDSWGAKL